MSSRPRHASPDDTPADGSVIAGLAQRQHGEVDRGQLLELGFTRSSITRLTQAGWHDAESDTDLELTGLRVMRLTWDDVTTREARTVRRLEPRVVNDRR